VAVDECASQPSIPAPPLSAVTTDPDSPEPMPTLAVMKWRRRMERTVAVIGDRDTTFFFAVASLVGLFVGVGTWLLVETLAVVSEFVDRIEASVPGGRRLVLVLVPLGIVAAWWIARRFAPEVAGDGVPEATAALAVRGGYLATKTIPLKILVTALTLGVGGSAGREGPIVQVGSTIGSSIARRFRLGEDQIRSLVAAGAGAAIGASFNAPIAGMLFALEVILRSFSVRHLSAVVVASVVAAVTSERLVGEELSIQAVPYDLQVPGELLLYAGLALVIVAAAVLFLRLIEWSEGLAERLERTPILRPLAMGLAVAGLGLLEPRVLGTGQGFVTDLLVNQQRFDVAGTSQILWWTILAIALAKIAATSFTLASGGSGGAFMPSLFIGAALGTAFAQVAQPFWDASLLQPGAFAVVGMAAMFAAVARAPLTAMLIVFEVTGAREYSLVLPLMLAATVATFLAERFHRESVYTLPLVRRGIRLVQTSEVDLLDTVLVQDVMTQSKAVARPDWSLAKAQAEMDHHRYHGLPVVDDQDRLVGIITVTDILRAGGPLEDLTVSQAMTRKPVTVVASTPVSHALERMAVLGVGRLPVVDEHDPVRLIGMFRREDAVRAYHHALGATTDHHLARERLRRRTEPGSLYYDFRIPPGSVADGKSIKEVAWPEGSTLVSVRRGRDVLVPTGNTVLRAGDVVTAFGTRSSRERMIERLNAAADEPTAELPIAETDEPPQR